MSSNISKRNAAALLATISMVDDDDDEQRIKNRKWCKKWLMDKKEIFTYDFIKSLRII